MLEILRHGSREFLHNNNNCFVGEKKNNDDDHNFPQFNRFVYRKFYSQTYRKTLDFSFITTPIRCFVTENWTLKLKPFLPTLYCYNKPRKIPNQPMQGD